MMDGGSRRAKERQRKELARNVGVQARQRLTEARQRQSASQRQGQKNRDVFVMQFLHLWCLMVFNGV